MLGSGREDVCRTIAGIVTPDAAQVLMDGKRLPFGSPAGAIKAGIGYVPQIVVGEGLVIYLSIGPNITLPDLAKVVRGGFLSQGAEKKLAVEWIDKLAIKTPGPSGLSRTGPLTGNQQKVVLAKWLASKVKVFVLLLSHTWRRCGRQRGCLRTRAGTDPGGDRRPPDVGYARRDHRPQQRDPDDEGRPGHPAH